MVIHRKVHTCRVGAATCESSARRTGTATCESTARSGCRTGAATCENSAHRATYEAGSYLHSAECRTGAAKGAGRIGTATSDRWIGTATSDRSVTATYQSNAAWTSVPRFSSKYCSRKVRFGTATCSGTGSATRAIRIVASSFGAAS